MNQNTTAFVFPGQGSQYVGMGLDFYENRSFVNPVFEEADKILGFPISKLAFEGPSNKLNQMINAQPAILMVSVAHLEMMRYQSILPAMVAGHSLGEYSALVAAEVLTYRSALRIVRKRGELMEKAYPAGKGGMAAVLRLGVKELEEAITAASDLGLVTIANYNCPGQLVISGEKLAVDKVALLAKQKGAKRVIPLQVSGPFHSPLMNSAVEKFAAELENFQFNNPKVRFFTNVGGKELTSGKEIKKALVRQLTEGVAFEQQIRLMIKNGARQFYEVGPGQVLSGLVRRIDNSVTINDMGED